MHRGSGEHTLGDPIYAIQTFYGTGSQQYSMVKTFPSLSGFKAGLRAVKVDVQFRHTGSTHYKTFILPAPTWVACNDQGDLT